MKQNPMRKLYLVGILFLLIPLACLSSGPRERSSVEDRPGPIATDAGSTTIYGVADDFRFTLDTDQAKAGTLTFVIRNEGNMPHDFELQGEGVSEKTSMLEPGETATFEVTLEPGTYEYICTVPGHAMLGMKGTFTVTQ